MQTSIKILCTRPLNEALINEAAKSGIDMDELPFIETEPIQSIAVQQEIELAFLQITPVVFTSMNAVEAVAYYQQENQPAWEIYCIGHTTRKLAAKYFGEERIAGTADDAASLAALIAENHLVEEVTFFCGDQRRNELPDILAEHGIEVNEIVVYQTIELPHKTDKFYNGILFFSPSAVKSFFRNNQPPAATILFAIGNTTANEMKKYTGNKIITGNGPGKENLVARMIEYFTGG